MADLQNSSWGTITDTDRIEVTAPVWATKLKVIVKTEMVNGWIAFDNLTVQRQSAGGSWSTLTWSDGDFEDPGDWTTTTDSDFPASSVWFGESGPAAAQAGRYSLVMSNLGYSQSTTPLFAMDNAAYAGHRAYAWLRGDIGSALAGGVYLVAHYYDSGDDWLGQETLWFSNRTEEKLWQQIQGEMEPISGTTQMQLQLVNAFTTGTFQFDDISAEYYGGFLVDPHDVPDPGFEMGGSWTEWANSTGTAARSADGSAHGGSYVLSIANNHLADGYAQSQAVAVTAGETYRFQVWVKQQIDSGGAVSHLTENSHHPLTFRACFTNFYSSTISTKLVW
jgi:hypothetical protein